MESALFGGWKAKSLKSLEYLAKYSILPYTTPSYKEGCVMEGIEVESDRETFAVGLGSRTRMLAERWSRGGGVP